MTNHKEILRLKSLGLTNTDIAAACTCGRNTVTRTLARAQENGLTWEKARAMSQQEVSLKLFPEEVHQHQCHQCQWGQTMPMGSDLHN